MAQGFVYVLVSPNSDYVKIGRTERPIIERLRGINGHEAYAEHGPWELSDFLHVTDCELVEREMHKHFRDRHVATVVGTNELFGVPPHEAREKLRAVDMRLRVDHEKTDQLFADRDIALFLFKLFQLSGLYGNLDIQGAWTLSLQPKTAGGRWFTLNVGPHEVAYSSRKPVDGLHCHSLVLDRLILEYPETIMWIGQHEGKVEVAPYDRAERAVSVYFWESFASAERFFRLPGVRRALIAYWGEALADLRERNAKSVYARYHSYDAVSQLMAYRRARQLPFGFVVAKPAPASL
ncbi:GIY-YIG nuclease family protein [Bradyrhizobium sp. th.b2]|uniref:GIY-YIG nuclease family protein n=1 Tax=Bradyrhizobium sp. th-b2 TaxID=172088 RepID=UPI000A0554B4|nr:GIY-YIG nuclease family protein [Bradyrhizobium sp. th.b2]